MSLNKPSLNSLEIVLLILINGAILFFAMLLFIAHGDYLKAGFLSFIGAVANVFFSRKKLESQPLTLLIRKILKRLSTAFH